MIAETFDGLAARPLWLCWKTERRNGKSTKVPFTIDNRPASSTDAKTWTTLAEAQRAAPRFDGLGIALAPLNDGRHLGGVDLDACIDDQGNVAAWTREIVELMGSYTEVSPSGHGLKIFFTYDSRATARRRWRASAKRQATNGGGKDAGIEFYLKGRYFTVTGSLFESFDAVRHVPLDTLIDVQKRMDAFSPPRNATSKERAPPREKTDDHDLALLCLAHVANDGEFIARDRWLEIGMALHDATGGSAAGLLAWASWTAQKHSNAQDACTDAWKSFVPGRGFTVATLIEHARRRGFDPYPRTRRPDTSEPPPPESDDHGGLSGDAEPEHAADRAGAKSKAKRKAKAGTTEPPPGGEIQGDEWMGLCSKTDKGTVNGGDSNNVALALRHAAVWQGVLAYDAFSHRVVVRKPIPRPAGAPVLPLPAPRGLTDVDVTGALQWFHWKGLFGVRKEPLYDAMIARSHECGFHSVLDYFTAVQRAQPQKEAVSQINAHRIDPDRPPADALSLLLTCGFGADDTPLNRALSRAFMVAMVRRVKQPGCQHDHMLVLTGEQGRRKSSGLRALVGDAWFTDHLPDLHSKDAMLQLHGKVLIEWSEMGVARRAEAERIKAFITSRVDTLRKPYERATEDVPRTCSFAGSCNNEDFIDDATGGRRFWPVEIEVVDTDWITANRDLLWRLACEAEAEGEAEWIVARDLQAELVDRQADAQRDDVWGDAILDYAERHALADGIHVNAAFLFGALSIPVKDQHNGHFQRVTNILKRAGWRRAKRIRADGRKPRWIPGRAR